MKNKKVIIIVILFLIVLGLVLINPVKKELYSIQFEKDVKELLAKDYNVIDSFEFSGNYKLDLDLKMSSQFCSLDFFEQEKIIKSISNDLNDIYISYRDKVNKIDSSINYIYGMIKFNIDDYFYNTCFVSNTIHKNGNTLLEYSDSDYVIEQVDLKLSDINSVEKGYIKTYLSEIDNLETYKYILGIKDEDNLLLEIAYQYLLKLYNNKEYSESIFYYKSKLSNYKDSLSLLNKIDDYEKNRKAEYLKVPRIGMTMQEVLNTTWGEPKSKALDNPNSWWRYDDDGEEAFFYTRGTTRIMVRFKDGKVDSFYVTKKGDWTGRKVYSVDEY